MYQFFSTWRCLTIHPEALTDRGEQLFPRLRRFEGFYLAGGTGLALQLGHRISEDFDLFIDQYISDDLLRTLEEEFPDRKVSVAVNNSEELTVFIDNTKTSFLRYPFPLINSLKEYKDVSLMEASEIGATKAYTVGRRGSFKDYVDLYFCLREDYASLMEIIDLARKKYDEKFNARLFLEQLIYLDDIETTELRFIKEKVSKEEIKGFFEREIGKIEF